jgi:hypothetical protein
VVNRSHWLGICTREFPPFCPSCANLFAWLPFALDSGMSGTGNLSIKIKSTGSGIKDAVGDLLDTSLYNSRVSVAFGALHCP